MMIPVDARLTNFAGVYRFRNDRYLVTAVFTPSSDEYHATAQTIHGTLQNAIDKRQELLDELRFKFEDVGDIGPKRPKRPPAHVIRRRPPPIEEEEEEEEDTYE